MKLLVLFTNILLQIQKRPDNFTDVALVFLNHSDQRSYRKIEVIHFLLYDC